MKVVVTCNSESEYYQELSIDVDNGQVEMSFRDDGEPEDASMSRDYKDVYNIVEAMQIAYAAGKAGKPFRLIEVNPDDDTGLLGVN